MEPHEKTYGIDSKTNETSQQNYEKPYILHESQSKTMTKTMKKLRKLKENLIKNMDVFLGAHFWHTLQEIVNR